MKNFNLQLLADEGAAESSGATEGANSEGAAESSGATKTSFDDLMKDKDYQSAFDKRVNKAIDTAKTKWEADAQAKQSEAEKLAKMNAEEKAKHQLVKREEELSRKEREIEQRELRATAIEELGNIGLSAGLADNLNYTDADMCKASIDALHKAIGIEVEKQVNERLRGNPPKTGGGGQAGAKGYEEQLTAARKAGNTQEAIRIKQEAAAKGEILL